MKPNDTIVKRYETKEFTYVCPICFGELNLIKISESIVVQFQLITCIKILEICFYVWNSKIAHKKKKQDDGKIFIRLILRAEFSTTNNETFPIKTLLGAVSDYWSQKLAKQRPIKSELK